MRSLKYAKGVVSGERIVSKEVLDNAKDYISIIEGYNEGNNIINDGIASISEAIEYEEKYMSDVVEWNDALVFAVIYSLIKGNTLYYVPRKNGKSRFTYYIMRFIHLYRNDLRVGIYSCNKDMAHCTMSDFIHNMFLEGYKSSKSQKSVRVKGKNNEYILFSENSPTGYGSRVDILLVEELFSLKDENFNRIVVNKDILATSTSFFDYNEQNLSFETLDKNNLFPNRIKYCVEKKDFCDVEWTDIVKSNPVLESELFNKREKNINERFLQSQYERCKNICNAQENFLVKHLNMTCV